MNDRTPPPSIPSPGAPPRPRKSRAWEYATYEAANVTDLSALLASHGADGWRYAGFDGERYIFERPRQDSPELHER